MRAARLLDMLMVLQRRGRTTAGELAELLEVSERTVLRDVSALNEAGVPIFAVRGAGGGIDLVEGFRTYLTGLTTEEARALFLAGQRDVAHRLGLGVPARAARHKLLAALSPEMAAVATGLASWFLHDPDPWTATPLAHGELRRLARCIDRRREVEVTIGRRRPRRVRPLGLVLKAGSWHLVCAGRDAIDVVCLDDLRATRITGVSFTSPEDFDLSSFWRRYVAGAVDR